jgi:hypothetical protein
MIRRLSLICAIVLSAFALHEGRSAPSSDPPPETAVTIFSLACAKAAKLPLAGQVALCSCAYREWRGAMSPGDLDSFTASVQAAGPDLAKMIDVAIGDERVKHAVDACLPNGFPKQFKDPAGQLMPPDGGSPAPSNLQRMMSAPPDLQRNFYFDIKSAATGAHQLLDTVYMVNGDCTSGGYPSVRVRYGPFHGRITDEPSSAYFNFPPNDIRGACNDGRIEGLAIYYESQPGFIGKDNATVEIIYPSGQLRTYDYQINVR